jgi:hypothetical protein
VPYLGALALGVVWLFEYDMEIFLRPDVAFFFLLGGLIRAKEYDVKLSRRAIYWGFASYCAFVAPRAFAPYVFEASSPLLALFTRTMRLIGVVACWSLFLRLAASRFGPGLARWGPNARGEAVLTAIRPGGSQARYTAAKPPPDVLKLVVCPW